MTTRNHQDLEKIGGVYSITATVAGWKHVFIKQKYLDEVMESFHFFQKKRSVYTVGYCIMPNHIHWIIKLSESQYDFSKILQTFKSYIAHQMLHYISVEDENSNHPNYAIFDDNKNVVIESPKSLLSYFSRLAENDADQAHRFWQRDSDVKLIESYNFLQQKLDYIHRNPIQDNWMIVEDPVDYQYSSCGYYMNGIDWNRLRIANLS